MKLATILVLVVLFHVSYQLGEDRINGRSGRRSIRKRVTKFLRSTKASDYGSSSNQQSSNAGYKKSAGNDGYAKQRQAAGSNSYGDEGSSGMPYSFDWAVKDEESNNDYGHKEESDGQVVSGSYRVLMADGRTQVVNYRVEGDSGYVATVTYEGEANTDQQAAPVYQLQSAAKATTSYGSSQGSSANGQRSSSGSSGSSSYGQGSTSAGVASSDYSEMGLQLDENYLPPQGNSNNAYDQQLFIGDYMQQTQKSGSARNGYQSAGAGAAGSSYAASVPVPVFLKTSGYPASRVLRASRKVRANIHAPKPFNWRF